LENELENLIRQRSQRRHKRLSADVPTVAIVGYTNAGKSTLLNTLTRAGVLAEDKLFATLDPRARHLHLPTGLRVVLTDTVGFIRDMPETLFTAFRATFEEAADADLLLEVVDASDPEHLEHMRATTELLTKLGLSERPRLVVLNKIDLLGEQAQLSDIADASSIALSATDHSSTGTLLARIVTSLFELGYRAQMPQELPA